MIKRIKANVIIETLKAYDYEAYLVGGCVRDQLLGLTPKDYDIATNATPTQIIQIFPSARLVGAKFGVTILQDEDGCNEIATFRKDGKYSDGRHPESIEFGSLQDDANRRDFTINGLYHDIRTNETIDLVNGINDLNAKIIRAIGDPQKRFEEDYLRILRAIRFAARLGFTIEPDTRQQIINNAHKLAQIAPERIMEEIRNILHHNNTHVAFRLMQELGVLKVILPEVSVLESTHQSPQFHPEGNVFEHTMKALEFVEKKEFSLGLGVLFHDIGKPATLLEHDGKISFKEHAKVGADLSVEILKRFKVSNEVIDIVKTLVYEHMRFCDASKMKLSKLKRFLRQDHFHLLLELHKADCLGSDNNLEYYDFCLKKKEEIGEEILKPPRLITGLDLILAGYKPGILFGQILKEIEDLQLDNKIFTKEECLEYVTQKYGVPPYDR